MIYYGSLQIWLQILLQGLALLLADLKAREVDASRFLLANRSIDNCYFSQRPAKSIINARPSTLEDCLEVLQAALLSRGVKVRPRDFRGVVGMRTERHPTHTRYG